MKVVTFIDSEVQPRDGKILDLGALKDSGELFHANSLKAFKEFISGSNYCVGHNIFKHDLKFIGGALESVGVGRDSIIDTLHLSALLFPKKPYHSLVKDEKLQSDDINNPLSDSTKCRDLFHDELAAFASLDEKLKDIFYLLLYQQDEFRAFFRYVNYKNGSSASITTESRSTHSNNDFGRLEDLIQEYFNGEICEKADLRELINADPASVAYALAVINVKDRFSVTPPWVLKSYPRVDLTIDRLRNRPCLSGCSYCRKALDPHLGLNYFFGFDAFRTYEGEPLQEEAVKAAIDGKSLLAVFPTGGGKSLTFQLPALMSGESVKGLTVVISPLQSLMKDQVDNLELAGITEAVTINGLLDPIERAKSIERVQDGSASILYISPESLRSRTIEHLLAGRKVARFVIDEAHCFSSWGHDFRVDYLYIGDFIKKLQELKNLPAGIPISCFTATAKQMVIEDIKSYFKEKLGLALETFTTEATRSNLRYKVIEKRDQDEKYAVLRNLLLEKNCPAIIYVSRTKRADDMSERLREDGFNAAAYHGKMDKKEKSKNQDDFIAGVVSIIVATSAFGMGVDKKDVGLVVHFDISDSLENYIQEAGRAGRDENITADCYILYCEEDLDSHFILLNQTKVNIKEIQQVWKALKDVTRLRLRVSQSALEIARKAGWDEGISDLEMRVKTAISALEESGYIRRGRNMPRIFADSILCKNAREAIDKINASPLFEEEEKVQAIRIIRKLISSKSRSQASGDDADAESRVDYISDHLGLKKETVIGIINLLRQENILADAKDLNAYIQRDEKENRSMQVLENYNSLENFLITAITEEERIFNIKELNEMASLAGCKNVSPNRIKVLLNFGAIKKMLKYKQTKSSKNHLKAVTLESSETLRKKLEKRHRLASFIISHLFTRSNQMLNEAKSSVEEYILVGFSVKEIKDSYESSQELFKIKVTNADIEEALFYLSRIEAIKLEGGFMVIYNPMNIERLEQDNRRRYRAEDYRKLEEFYDNKVQQIHIVGEYARKIINDYQGALQFVEDYFHLNYSSFLEKYFKGDRRKEIRNNITPTKFRKLFGELSPAQLSVIRDNNNQYIAVLAGPGSGKTKVLVHKLASIVLMEDVKFEQLLMLTFSRAAVHEFKKRLYSLIGNAVNFIEIKTFHAYCFDLLGKMGDVRDFKEIVPLAVERIKTGEVESGRITKTVLVIDEAQDMDKENFALVQALLENNESLRVILVGDDDQNIFEFRGSSSEYLERFTKYKDVQTYELLENYRSKNNLVEFTNSFTKLMTGRLKSNQIMAHNRENGTIKIVKYPADSDMITPVVEDVAGTELKGSTCVLARTNHEALQITGLLLEKKFPARLIQSNEFFPLIDLAEMRYFSDMTCLDDTSAIISDDIWDGAKRALQKKFYQSELLNLSLKIVKEFQAIYPKKYKTDFKVFLGEAKLEDFYDEGREKILVSTIHKAKGREFDNVFLLLNNFELNSEEAKRQLYVAMTRAKTTLSCHTNKDYFDRIKADGVTREEKEGSLGLPPKMVLQLSHKDVLLDYFFSRQEFMEGLVSGAPLIYKDGEWVTKRGLKIFRYSQNFKEKFEEIMEKGYQPSHGKINFVVFWQKKEWAQGNLQAENSNNENREIKIALPELHLTLPR